MTLISGVRFFGDFARRRRHHLTLPSLCAGSLPLPRWRGGEGPGAPLALAVLAVFALINPAAAQGPRDPWALVASPVPGRAEAVGFYTHGCLIGGEALPPQGPGFEVLNRARNRFWGHPELIRYIERLGRRAKAAGLPDFYIGDMAQPRGGPMPIAHAAHQLGIEADIWLELVPEKDGYLPPAARENFEPPSMLLANYHAIDTRRFGPRQVELLKLAATDPEVARIFVNPVIKAALCRSVLGSTPDERQWLRVIRPWFGHAAHFHVRLKCPASSPQCQPQKAPPPGDGCGYELQSWLRHLPPPPTEHIRPLPVMPAACRRVLSAPESSVKKPSAVSYQPSAN
jgi:penicillin-insensitive murein endopeptidase